MDCPVCRDVLHLEADMCFTLKRRIPHAPEFLIPAPDAEIERRLVPLENAFALTWKSEIRQENSFDILVGDY